MKRTGGACDHTLYSQLNDKRRGAIAIVMQWLLEDDLVGHVLAQEPRTPALSGNSRRGRGASSGDRNAFWRRQGEVRFRPILISISKNAARCEPGEGADLLLRGGERAAPARDGSLERDKVRAMGCSERQIAFIPTKAVAACPH